MAGAVPSLADVTLIAANTDSVLRNLLITQCYHELAVAVRAVTGAGANWCTFAAWASRQAGRTIRREDLREALRARLGRLPEARALAAAVLADAGAAVPAGQVAGLAAALVRAIELDGALERAANAVAAGNLKVFEEIATEFARFLETGAAADAEALRHFVQRLRPGDPPDGQQLLRAAFEAYAEASVAESQATRAQLMHFANLLIGVHEQTRLQPQIAAAMNAAFDADAVRERLLAVLLPGAWRRVRYRLAALFGRRPPLDVMIDSLLAAAQRELRRIVTANAMTLQFPGGVTVRLGQDVAGTHAPSLTRITERRLLELLRRVDPAPDTLAGGGTVDWSVLEQRLHFIADLFRCHHEWPALYDPPFSSAQVERLRSGQVPAPPL